MVVQAYHLNGTITPVWSTVLSTAYNVMCRYLMSIPHEENAATAAEKAVEKAVEKAAPSEGATGSGDATDHNEMIRLDWNHAKLARPIIAAGQRCKPSSSKPLLTKPALASEGRMALEGVLGVGAKEGGSSKGGSKGGKMKDGLKGGLRGGLNAEADGSSGGSARGDIALTSPKTVGWSVGTKSVSH
jgi:hypothetical protein